ncbi:hypothetical protein Clacol_001671 [Clathrus columnatus]|uniref:PX domain-containing protein n=1 Tax=Clathrus columnatus TaxID=1419009 RepID=A0AAV4ZYR4_9AGAM|nr:hypothetical protein Clacol_001671 [Clathrus columnatus]
MSNRQDNESESQKDTILTPIRAHYLKKTLISLQFNNELQCLIQPSLNPSVSPFSYLGSPFTPPPKDALFIDLPLLRFVFRQFVLSFPFLASAPRDFFPQKVQPFLESFLSRNLSITSPFDQEDQTEQTEQATRDKFVSKIQKQLTLLLVSAVKLSEPEDVVRLTQRDLNRLETLARRRRVREARLKDSFDVNVIGVRAVIDKGRVRSKVHEEFIIRMRRANHRDIIVSRRYGDFRTLAEELRKYHPDAPVPSPPAKDRTIVSAPLSPTPTQSFGSVDQDNSQSPIDGYEYHNSSNGSIPTFPTRLAREKNRLTLRAYLHSLLSSSTFANSPVLRSFLTADPITLTTAEAEDARRREEADRTREEGRKRFAQELTVKVESLRGSIKAIKGDIMGKNGLHQVFTIIKACPNVRDLPPEFRAVIEWGRLSLASAIFHHFVASDSASESLAGLKRIHGLMPYFALKGFLKISNPVAMIRGVLDLFLAQPFGNRSLLQRMFTSNLSEEIKALQEDISSVCSKIEDPILCEKVRLFVYAPVEIQDLFKADAAVERLDLLAVILRSSEEPALSHSQMQRVVQAHQAHQRYRTYRDSLEDSDDDTGPQDDDAWLYEDLHILGKLYSRLRDREQLMELIFEGTTADLLKDIITIFYSPLAQVYKAANIADSLGDLQNFLNDLIKTVEQAEVTQQDSVHVYVDLVQRHEQSFYNFVHKVHSKGEGLFDNLIKWLELFINFMRDGLREPVSLEFLLPHTGPDRLDIIREVDEVALYHYRLKIAYESKLRRRFVREGSSTDIEDEEVTQALVDDVVKGLSFGELIEGDAEDLAAEDSTDESESEDGSEYETDSYDDAPGDLSISHPDKQTLQVTPLPNSRSQTMQIDDTPPPIPPKDPKFLPRKQPTSLRSSKSIADLRSKRATRPQNVPPVPLPPNLAALSLVDHLPPNPHRVVGMTEESSRPHSKKPSKPKFGSDIKPPDLKVLNNLVPLFVEMIRSNLQPRPLE